MAFLQLFRDRGETLAPHRSTLAVALALLLAVLGLALAIHLFSVHPAAARAAQETSMSSNNGIVTIPSHHPIDWTIERRQQILAAKGVKVFAVIDTQQRGRKGWNAHAPVQTADLRQTKKAGTPLMLASPTAALDLPLQDSGVGEAGRQAPGSLTTTARICSAATGCPPS
jgi:hypothetical protein